MFAVYIGGERAGANIEVHDMRFVVAPSIDQTHAELLRQWWGKRGTLHIDCWAELNHADGYDVALRPEPFVGEERLYFINLGGYDPTEFAERHRNIFVVAATENQAKARAIKRASHWVEPHRDDMYEAEQAFGLANTASDQILFIHLTPTQPVKDLAFTCDYIPIHGRPAKSG
nr:DUF1543 domain-containing protein [Sphingobium boeckii]